MIHSYYSFDFSSISIEKRSKVQRYEWFMFIFEILNSFFLFKIKIKILTFLKYEYFAVKDLSHDEKRDPTSDGMNHCINENSTGIWFCL